MSLKLEGKDGQDEIKVFINGNLHFVPSGITVLRAVENVYGEGIINKMCNSGACYNCCLVINGQFRRSCITPIEEGMEIFTDKEIINRYKPLRLVSIIPTYLHPGISCFTHGCNFACPWCHNWNISFSSVGNPVTPKQLAEIINRQKGNYSMIGISGGEPILNRRWLVDFLKEMKYGNRNLPIQVDTNGSVLAKDYIDELYYFGMTHVSLDIKANSVEAFMSITGIKKRQLAQLYLNRTWEAVKYIVNNYTGKLFYTIAIPYHPKLNSLDEIYKVGKRLASLDRDIDVNLVEYHPAFRAREMPQASRKMVEKAMNLLHDAAGLNNVWLQGSEDAPRPLDPEYLMDFLFERDNM